MQSRTMCFVRFFSPGSFLADNWTVEVADLDPLKVVWPERAYAFTMHTREDILRGGEVFKGEVRQVGPMYYHPDSRSVSREEVAARNDPRDRILLRNMGINGWPSVIFSRWGNWPQPYRPGEDVILEKRHGQVP